MPLTLAEDWAEYHSGPYRTVNNVWNKGPLQNGPDFAQSITYDPATFPAGVTMEWSWPGFKPSIYAYPEVILGYKPWDPGKGTLEFSAKVDALKRLEATFDLGIAGETGKFNVALELWLTDTRGGGPGEINTEVMIWLHNGDLTPAGREKAAFATDGYGASIYVEKGMGDNSGESPLTWKYIALKADTDYLTGVIDLREVLIALKREGLITGKEWVSGFELGAEVAGGDGMLSIAALDHAFARYRITSDSDTLRGTERDDAIDGRGGGDRIDGLAGDDDLRGGPGGDRLAGGPGNDRLKGGAGKDSLGFDAALGGDVDRIAGFSVGDDTIGLDGEFFAGIGGKGTLGSGAFHSGPEAGDADDRIICDDKAGTLSYDPDGLGGAAETIFARLGRGLDLTSKDFLVV
jgi:Ca2+-binding RTX toxin-like protein